MRLPRRSLRSIQPLPSVYTSFPTNPDCETAVETIDEVAENDVEEGIELVPIERSNTTCAKTVSPGTEEKEVVAKAHTSSHISTKPLPRLPSVWRRNLQSEWKRSPLKQRIGILLLVQIGMAIVVIGTLVAVEMKASNAHMTNGQPTTDAPSPAPDSPAIKQGTFALALGDTRQQSSACLARSNESAAWLCMDAAYLQVIISPSLTERSRRSFVAMGPFPVNNQTFYGQQSLTISSTELRPAIDSEMPEEGPGYKFRASYNRTVVVRGHQLFPDETSPEEPSTESSAIQPHQTPWVCYFNDTQVEGFIYASQNVTAWNVSTSLAYSNATQAPYLPYALKLSEQRQANSTSPYCSRATVTDQGQLQVNVSNTRALALSDTVFILDQPRKMNASSAPSTKRQEMGTDTACHCQWIVQ